MSAPSTPRQVETGFWLVLWLGLALGIGTVTEWGAAPSPVAVPPVQPAAFEKPALIDSFRLPPPDQFLEITLRPLFIVSRRPTPAAPMTDGSRPAMQKGQFVLLGTTIVPGGRFAFLLERAGNKSRVVAEGKEINGIMVKEVHPDRVVLIQGDDSEVLPLRTNKPASPGSQTAAQPPATRMPPPIPQPGGPSR